MILIIACCFSLITFGKRLRPCLTDTKLFASIILSLVSWLLRYDYLLGKNIGFGIGHSLGSTKLRRLCSGQNINFMNILKSSNENINSFDTTGAAKQGGGGSLGHSENKKMCPFLKQENVPFLHRMCASFDTR